jgi:hypothetical protein
VYSSLAAGRSVKRQVQARYNSRGEIVEPWDGKNVQDLHREYSNVFRHGNRNAASHLWSSFLIDRAAFMPRKRFEKISSGFCAVSGSPVTPMSQTRYKMKLQRVDGAGDQIGYMYYCCWPCVCDTEDFIRADTKTVETQEGKHQYNVAVIGNPCNKPRALYTPFTQPFDGRQTTIAASAPEVQCTSDGKLEGATMSDNGFVILSIFFDASGDTEQLANDEYRSMCDDRKDHGYNSGMGEIFRRVAAISPVQISQLLLSPSKLSSKQLRIEAVRRGIDTRGIADKSELVSLLSQSMSRELHKMNVKTLRTQASKHGLDMRGMADKADIIRRLEESIGIRDSPEMASECILSDDSTCESPNSRA